MSIYPMYPGYRPTDTSVSAAHSVAEKANTVRWQVLRTIIRRGSFGATSIELADLLGLSYDTVQPRTSELRKLGKIVDSGRRRVNRTSGKNAIVWVAAPDFPTPRQEAIYDQEKHPLPSQDQSQHP